MSVEGYAQFSVITALASTFATFVNNVASGTVLNREIATKPYKTLAYIKKAFSIRVFTFFVGAVIIFLYSKTKYGYGNGLGLCVVALLSYDVFYEFFEQVAFGYKITKYSSIINISAMFMLLLIFIVLPSEWCSLQSVLTIYVCVYILKYCVYYFCDLKEFKRSDYGEKAMVKEIINPSLPYFWMRVVGTLSTQLPVLLLEGYSDISEVSYYSVGNKFTLPLTILVNTAINAFFPYYTQYFKQDTDKYKKMLFSMLSMAIQISSVFAVVMSVSSPIWLPLIMGNKYISAVYPFQIQVWYTCVLCIDLIISMAFSSSFKQNVLAVITTIDVIILLPVLYFTISYGAVGVSLSKIICSVACLVYHVIIIFQQLKPTRKQIKAVLTQILSMIILIAITTLIKDAMMVIASAIIVIVIGLFIELPVIKELIVERSRGNEL
jgi:O-antigen/teichoic acid export membrane protein